jgi:RNA polymerase sigma-70 factor (ECF subfamily)
LTEEELIQACIKGNQKACKDLYDHNKGWLYAVCLHYHKNEVEAQESLQESFITIFRNLHKFSAQGSFKGWMRKVTVRCILSSFRKNKKFPLNDLELKSEPVDLELLQSLGKDEILYLLSRLSPGRKQIFIAHAIDGFSHKEIAEMLTISEGTSKSQFFHARRELREAIEKEIVIAKKYEHE